MAVNKVVYGTTVLVDLTADTVTAATLMQGYTAHDKSGALITGTATGGGGGDTYTLTTIVPEQTFTAQEATNDSYQAVVTYTAGLEDGESYLVTFDGEQYACECGVLWGNDYMAGMIGTFWGDRSDNPFPFGLDYVPSENVFVVGSYDLNQHTIKVEHLELVDGPLNLIAKSVTVNGTYNASSDNADGYSSVTVNVAGGGSTTYRLDNIVPEQTVACTTFMQNNAYYGLPTYSSPIDDAEQYLVTFDGTEYVCEGYVPEANATGVGDIRVTQTNAAQYLITPFFIEYQTSLGTGLIVRGSGTHTIKVDKLTFIDDGETFTTKTITENGTYSASSDNADGYSSVTVNVPSGSSMNVQTAQSTTRATSSTYTKLVSLTCSVTGTYDVYWDCFRSTTGGTSGSQLYIGGSASGSANTTFSNHAQTNHLTGVQINANQEVAVYVGSRGTNYYAYCGQLTIVQTA